MDDAFEFDHVHTVYDVIANDFSRTRFKQWPFIRNHLINLPFGSTVLDAGCGNGKYLGAASALVPSAPPPTSAATTSMRYDGDSDNTQRSIMSIGLDMSFGLLSIAHQRGHEVVRGDCFDLSCWRPGTFDHAISIAIIHHFATVERRIESIKQLILAVLPLPPAHPSSSAHSSKNAASSSTSASSKRKNSVLIFVWALEQDPSYAGVGSARKGKMGVLPVSSLIGTTSSRLLSSSKASPFSDREAAVDNVEDLDGRAEVEIDGEQDVLVPWALQPAALMKEKKKAKAGKCKRSDRKSKEEWDRLVAEAETTTAAAAAEVDDGVTSDGRLKQAGMSSPHGGSPLIERPTFHRYYHLFRHLELTNLVRQAAVQLGATFVDPSGNDSSSLPLPSSALSSMADPALADSLSKSDTLPAKEKGCDMLERRMVVEMNHEVWERENWVVEFSVSWRT